jgi:hypothetical protein
MVHDFMECYTKKSEVRQDRRFLGRRRLHGLRLDTNRLVEAVLASRVGLEPRLFRQAHATIEPVFHPRQHLVVLAFDLNDLRGSGSYRNVRRAEPLFRFLACVITVYRRLEVDFIILAFADRLLKLPRVGDVCLHLAMKLKGLDEEVDSAFWNRLSHLSRHPFRFPGEPCCFHPLSLRDLTGPHSSAKPAKQDFAIGTWHR